MTLNRVKLARAVTFMKYLASAVPFIFLAKTLICNKVTFPALNSLNIAELVVKEPTKSIYKKDLPIFLFLLDLSLVNVKISRGYNYNLVPSASFRYERKAKKSTGTLQTRDQNLPK